MGRTGVHHLFRRRGAPTNPKRDPCGARAPGQRAAATGARRDSPPRRAVYAGRVSVIACSVGTGRAASDRRDLLREAVARAEAPHQAPRRDRRDAARREQPLHRIQRDGVVRVVEDGEQDGGVGDEEVGVGRRQALRLAASGGRVVERGRASGSVTISRPRPSRPRHARSRSPGSRRAARGWRRLGSGSTAVHDGPLPDEARRCRRRGRRCRRPRCRRRARPSRRCRGRRAATPRSLPSRGSGCGSG